MILCVRVDRLNLLVVVGGRGMDFDLQTLLGFGSVNILLAVIDAAGNVLVDLGGCRGLGSSLLLLTLLNPLVFLLHAFALALYIKNKVASNVIKLLSKTT